jgi:hypothetical protein
MKSKTIFNLSVFLILFGVNLLPVNAQKNTNISNSNRDNNRSYVGLQYSRHNSTSNNLDYPKGIEYVAGWVVDDVQYPNLNVYGISRVKKGNQEMLWLEMVADRDRTGNPSKWLVLDVFNVPKINKSHTLIGHFCLRNGVRDYEIIAIAKIQDVPYYRQIQKAWRANQKTRKFEAISTKGISCENVGYGV